MIVQFILKGLFFYFLFLFIRSFFKGVKDSSGASESAQRVKRPAGQAKKQEDVVEADFRRL